MAQQARAKRRTSRAPDRPGLRVPWGRIASEALGFALLALSLTAFLAIVHPEGAVAGPLGRFLSLTFGWLAPGAATWLGALGLIQVTRRIIPQPWPWKRVAAATAASLALLGLAAMEARRQGSFEMTPGGGLVGRAVAETLVG